MQLRAVLRARRLQRAPRKEMFSEFKEFLHSPDILMIG